MSCSIAGTVLNASGVRHGSGGFLITSWRKCSRWLRVEDPSAPEGWRWQRLSHIAARWDIEVLFADGKEEPGLDQYQLMSTIALERFWTLAYVFLEEESANIE